MKTNIEKLEKLLKELQSNLEDGHTGGSLMILNDALTELNSIKRKAK